MCEQGGTIECEHGGNHPPFHGIFSLMWSKECVKTTNKLHLSLIFFWVESSLARAFQSSTSASTCSNQKMPILVKGDNFERRNLNKIKGIL